MISQGIDVELDPAPRRSSPGDCKDEADEEGEDDLEDELSHAWEEGQESEAETEDEPVEPSESASFANVL